MQNKKYNAPERTWSFPLHSKEDAKRIEKLADALGIRRITASLLYDRLGTDDVEAAADFINTKPTFHDPFLMKDMEKACERIIDAMNRSEHITVYGDYDVDGVTSVSVLSTYLKRRGVENCSYYIPCRLGEGYGLSKAAIDKIAQSGSRFMITVDTGITAFEEIGYARSLGIETVVTDHHECRRGDDNEIVVPDVPCVNPRQSECGYPFDELAGVGVVFKLICALEMRRLNIDTQSAAMALIEEFGELVAIGTVADVMPLVDENRSIVKIGLEMMRDPKFVGTRELIRLCAGADFDKKNKKRLSTSLISFTVAPRINAVGRMGDASVAVELFLSTDAIQATQRALELSEMNSVRQQKENEILSQALAKINQGLAGDKVIVLDDDTWHHGVIGIVASRITERYGLPSILISFEGNPEDALHEKHIGKGSGRSIKGFDLVRALDACKDKLVRFGGHELAAGLTVERDSLEDFKKAINDYADELPDLGKQEQSIYADLRVELDELDEELAGQLYLLEPYGQANPTPHFVVENVEIEEIYPLKEGKHVKLTVSSCGRSITALWFGKKYSEREFAVGDKVDILSTLELNEFMGRTSVQLHIKDIRASEEMLVEINEAADVYRSALHGGAYPSDMLPDRDDFAAVYRYLRASVEQEGEMQQIRYAVIAAHTHKSGRMPYIKLRAVLDIMCELGLILYSTKDNYTSEIALIRAHKRVDLESSELLFALRRRAAKK